MSPALSIAASLSPTIRQDIGIQVLARTEPISHLAATHRVSRKFGLVQIWSQLGNTLIQG